MVKLRKNAIHIRAELKEAAAKALDKAEAALRR
jgi:hypothetical protein